MKVREGLSETHRQETAKLKMDIVTLNKEVKDAKQAYSASIKETEKIQKKLNTADTKLKAKENAAKDAKQQVRHLVATGKKQSPDAEFLKLLEKNQTLLRESEAQKQRVATLEEQYAEERTQKKEERRKRKDCQSNVEKLSDDYKVLERQVEKGDRKRKRSKKQLKDALVDKAALEDEKNVLAVDKVVLETSLSDLQKNYKKLEKKLELAKKVELENDVKPAKEGFTSPEGSRFTSPGEVFTHIIIYMVFTQ
jgi:chromosome segregation ATPase